MPKEIPDGFQSLHFDTLTLSSIMVNWVERCSKARIIFPTMCVLFTKDGKT
jgi:hypothetical protein